MTKDEALTLALEALEGADMIDCDMRDAINAIKEVLAQPEQHDRPLQIAMRQWEEWKAYALDLQKKLVKYEGGSPMILNTQPEQEPVEWGVDWGPNGNSVSIIKRLAGGGIEVVGWEYAPHPPQRTWVGLTDEELAELSASGLVLWGLWRAIEAKLKEKNNAV